MKKRTKPILIGSFLGLMLAIFWAANWNENNPVSAAVNVTHGRGGSPCRTSPGVCSFSLSAGEELNEEESRAKVYLNSEGKFVLQIAKTDISVANASLQFQDGKFAMTEDVPVPTEILMAIQDNRNSLTLKSGDYDFEETQQYFKIVLE